MNEMNNEEYNETIKVLLEQMSKFQSASIFTIYRTASVMENENIEPTEEIMGMNLSVDFGAVFEASVADIKSKVSDETFNKLRIIYGL